MIAIATTDAPIVIAVGRLRDITSQAVSLDTVIASIENAKKLRLVILDACRDNPFGKANQQGFERGLGRIEPAGATLVAYAAKHGQAASDGEGPRQATRQVTVHRRLLIQRGTKKRDARYARPATKGQPGTA